MNKTNVRQTAQTCAIMLKNIDFKQLKINQYSYEYIKGLLPQLEYYFRIYADSIFILLKKEVPQGYFVDFGGGHGFLSIFLKRLGFKVIYCDNNPLSVETITKLKEKTGIGPDHIVEGSSAELHAYCTVNKLKPSYLIGTDLIEHVYDLNLFFADLHQINPGFKMVFTTECSPLNPYQVYNLHKMMIDVENEFYFPMRSEFIRANYPNLTEKEVLTLAKQTRGLMYKNIDDEVQRYIGTKELPVLQVDQYNTCDPQSGSWLERILPLKEYQEILRKNGFNAEFKKGFYNERTKDSFTSVSLKALNCLVKYSGYLGHIASAYLIIKVVPKN